MIKTLKLIALLLIVLNANAQRIDRAGIGILEVNTNYDISFYKNHRDTIPAAILYIKQLKDSTVKYECSVELDPYEMHEGGLMIIEHEHVDVTGTEPILKFIVTKETPLYYKVIVNVLTGEQYYIKKNEKAAYYQTKQELTESKSEIKPFNKQWYVFETWCRYLKRVAFVKLYTIDIYDKPHGKKIVASNPSGFFPFTVEKMKGEWIKLKKLPLPTANFKADINYEGWYQWKKNNQLQIQIVENTYE
jgi:hypothetical protein